jgi:predicted Zn-dependent protease
VLYKTGAAEYARGRPADAIEPLRKALALDPKSAEAFYLLGVCQRALHDTDEAIRALRRAIMLDPTLVPTREELASLYASANQRREEIEQLEAIAALEPARPERAVAVALAYARSGRRESAVAAITRAIDRYPDDPLVYAALGRVWLDEATAEQDRDGLARALTALRTATASGDASSDALTLYGRALLAAGDARSAERVLQRAASRTPVDPDAYRYLADAAQRLRDKEVAAAAAARYAALAQ